MPKSYENASGYMDLHLILERPKETLFGSLEYKELCLTLVILFKYL